MSHRTVLLAAVALLFTACNTDTPTSPLVRTDARADAAGPPVIVRKFPASGATGVWRHENITVTFNEDMKASTINGSTFKLRRPDGSVVSASVSYSNRVAKLNPSSLLSVHTVYTARISENVQDAGGHRMGTGKSWSFTTGYSGLNGPVPVDLQKARNYAILAKSAVSTTGTTAIVGKVAVSPAAGTFLTGFSETMSSDNTYSTSAKVTGRLYAANYTSPTPSNLTTAVLDMQQAYTAAAGRTLPDFVELGAGNINGMTLRPGLYKWGTNLLIPIVVTLQGDTNDVFIFQVSGNLTVSNGAQVTLTGGALPKNIFWQVAGQVTIGTTAKMKGIILSKTLIAMQTGSTLSGRALAQTAVTLQAVHLTAPQ